MRKKEFITKILGMVLILCLAMPLTTFAQEPLSEAAAAPQESSDSNSTDTDSSAEAPKPEELESGGNDAELPPAENGGTQPEKPEPSKPPEEELKSNMVVTAYRIYKRKSNEELRKVERGDKVDLLIKVKNTGLKTKEVGGVSGINVTKPIDSFRYGGSVEVTVTSEEDQDLAFTLRLSGATYSGEGNQLQFIVSYPNLSVAYDIGEIKVLECVEYVEKNEEKNTGPEKAAPMLQLYRTSPTEAVSAKDKFRAGITVKNLSGDKDVENIQIGFETTEGLLFLDNTASSHIGVLKAGKTSDIELNMEAGPDLPFGAQYVTVTVKYDYISDKTRKQETFTEKIAIPTIPSKEKKVDAATPNLIISKYEFGDQVAAGNSFELKIAFKNTSPNLGVENIVMLLETGEALSITSSSNTFFFPSLGAGGTKEQTVTVQALAGGKPEANKIEVTFKYEFVDNDKRSQVTAAEKLAIPVFQPDRFQITPPVLAGPAVPGQEFMVSLPYVNKGRSDVYNVEAAVKGDMEILTPHQNLGNFEPGKSGTIDFILIPRETGKQTVTIEVIYEDVNMKQKANTFNVEVTVSEPETGGSDVDGFELPPPKDAPNRWILWAAACVIFLPIVLILLLRVIKRRKKKRNQVSMDLLLEMEEDETDMTDQGGDCDERQ